MVVVIGFTTVFTSHNVKDINLFRDQVKSLFNGNMPSFLWIYNESDSFRFWKLYTLYISENKVLADSLLSLSGYSLTLHRKSGVTQSDTSLIFDGLHTFTKNRSFDVHTVELDENGLLRFNITAYSMRDLDIALQYFDVVFDDFTHRDVTASMKSYLFTHSQPTPVNMSVTFSPIDASLCSFVFTGDQALETYFTDLYGNFLTLNFSEGFAFVFNIKASFSLHEYYLAPKGLAKCMEDCILMPGFSGTEYIRMKKGAPIRFIPFQKAYFNDSALPSLPQTSYVSFEGSRYYSQPQAAPYYGVTEKSGLFAYQELVYTPLQNTPICVFPYSGGEAYGCDGERLETLHLSPLRQKTLEESPPDSLLKTTAIWYAFTRHGMKVCLSHNELQWLSLASTKTTEPDVAFTFPKPKLTAGLMATKLFMVLREAAQLNGFTETPYTIDVNNLHIAEKNGYSYAKQLYPLIGRVYLSKSDFEAEVKQYAPVTAALLKACDNFILTVAGWQFLMSPEYWKDYNSVLIIKMHTENSISELINEPHTWAFRPADGCAAEAAAIINKILSDMKSAQESGKTVNQTLHDILYDKNWRGVVCFNCGINLDGLPEELSFLSKGVTVKEFKALYIAFPASTETEKKGSQITALVDYNDETHQAFSDYRAYSFKVLRLNMEIQNCQICHFTAKVELLINEMFHTNVSSQNSNAGNNLIFNGSYQESDDGGKRYVFVMDKPHKYFMDDCLFTEAHIENASLNTALNSCAFMLSGVFKTYDAEAFDFFSYDALSFTGMRIEMNVKDYGYDFKFITADMRFLQGNNSLREQSFANRFPIAPIQFLTGFAKPPHKLGYSRLAVKGIQSEEFPESHDWYAVSWEIVTGNLGDMASSVISKMELLTAWRVERTDNGDVTGKDSIRKFFTGLRYSAAGNSDDWQLSLQGIINLSFDSIELCKETKNNNTRYYFRFKNFGLTILGARFPATSNDLYLISDETKAIGWYGAMEG